MLSTADALLLTEVYPAGEPPIVAADGRALARAVRVAGKVEPVFVDSVAELPAAIRALVRDGDVVVTMGAGSIGQAPALLNGGCGMMMNEPRTFTALRGTLARDVPLARYTSWRCGGPGDRVYVPGRSRRSRDLRPPVAAGRAADGDRPRQQSARARWRHPRRRSSCFTPRSTCLRCATA